MSREGFRPGSGRLGDAVDRVRRAEHRRLAGAADQRLKGSRYARG